MKKTIKYLAIAICAIFAVSCGDDYLKVDHYGLVSPDGIYQDADNVFGGLVGIYSTFYVDYNGAWPHPVICNSPSLDMQNEGWDAEMTTDKEAFTVSVKRPVSSRNFGAPCTR